MKSFKEYQKEVESRKDPRPTLETILGSHSVRPKFKKDPRPTMATSLGKNSKINESDDEDEDHWKQEKISRYEEDNIHKQHARMDVHSLSAHENKAVETYADGSYETNDQLHKNHNGHEVKPKLKAHIEHLDKVLDRHKTEKDMHLYTGLKGSPSKHFKNTKESATVHLPAFTSTSTDAKVADSFAENTRHPNDKRHGVKTHEEGTRHILKIHAPKGTKATSMLEKSAYGHEKEVLLHRGHDIKIHPKPKHMGGGTYMWHAEIVGHTPGKLN